MTGHDWGNRLVICPKVLTIRVRRPDGSCPECGAKP